MEDLNSERDGTLSQGLNRSSFWFVMLADRNCLEMLKKLSNGKVRRIDEVRTELHLTIPEMARVTSPLLSGRRGRTWPLDSAGRRHLRRHHFRDSNGTGDTRGQKSAGRFGRARRPSSSELTQDAH